MPEPSSLLGQTISHYRTTYQDFFAQWKDADADVPVLKEAKAEYAKLKQKLQRRMAGRTTR